MAGLKPRMSALFVSYIKKTLDKFSGNHVTVLKSWVYNVDFDDNTFHNISMTTFFNNIDFETFLHDTIERNAPPFQRVILI